MSLRVSPLCPFIQFALFSTLFCFLLGEFFLGPLNQEDPAGKVGETAHVEASLVVGANTSIAPSGSTPPQVDRIKLAQEHMGLVQKLLEVSNRWFEYLTFIDRVVRYLSFSFVFLRVLALLSLNELLRMRIETDVSFTLEYSRISNPRGTIKCDQT